VSAASYIPGAVSGSYPIREGNRVRPLVGADTFFLRLCDAVETARHSVWVTVAFWDRAFLFPQECGGLLDVLDRAVARGVDVRLLAWRTNPEAGHHPIMFGGTPEDLDMLRQRGSRVKIRWDRAIGRYCQHQKSWVVDAGFPSETAFVGGANLTARSYHNHHDVYLEVTGPSATDVHHNFVQRWNEASERNAEDGNWNCAAADRLPFPAEASAPRGSSRVQVQRMLHAGRYFDGHPSPAGQAFDPVRGERSIAEQYVRAIDAARRTVYLENQAIPIMEIAAPLSRALERGVDIVLLVPAVPEKYVFAARNDPAERPRFEGVELLGRHPNFLLAGLAGRDAHDPDPLYVHAKLMIVDDTWTTIGSCNLHEFSLVGHCEMNASIWDSDVARELRCALLSRHLGADTGSLDDRAAFRLYREVAEDNRRRLETGEPAREGFAVALVPQLYGVR
jgi:cardiolipin synthase A/B